MRQTSLSQEKPLIDALVFDELGDNLSPIKFAKTVQLVVAELDRVEFVQDIGNYDIDPESLRQVVHELAGSVVLVGAVRLHERLADLETLLMAGDRREALRLSDGLKNLIDETKMALGEH